MSQWKKLGENAPKVSTELDPDEMPVETEMSDQERTEAETEKAEILAALRVDVPKTPPPSEPRASSVREFASKRLAAKREPVDPDAVRVRLTDANAKVKDQESAIAEAEAADQRAKDQRAAELDAARRELGAAQIEEQQLAGHQVGESIREKAERFRATAAENRASASSEDDDQRAAFTASAGPMIEKLEQYLLELDDFAQLHTPSLKVMASLTWQETPSEWLIQHRLQLVSRCANPARELLGSITDALEGGMDVISEARDIIAGRRPVRNGCLVKLNEFSRRTMQNYTSALAVLNTSVDRCEAAAKMHMVKGFKPSVVTRSRPITPPAESSGVSTGWNPHR